MPFWVYGRDRDTAQPTEPLFSEADSEDAARAEATAQGMVVESVEPDLGRQTREPLAEQRGERVTKYLVRAAVAIVLICAGLVTAALSDPRRFPLDPRFDAQIRLLATASFACTLTGIGLLVTAASRTTARMPPEKRTRANVAVGTALVLQLAGFFLWSRTGGSPGMIAPVLILISLPALVWGCMHYAEGKGHPRLVGLLGVAGIIGLMVLILLPNREVPRT